MRTEAEPALWAWPAEIASVPAARHQVVRHLEQAATPDPPLGDVALVVSEAVTNAVVHAYAGGEPGEVRVTVGLTADEVIVTIEDDGAGLVPRPDSPGLGLGLSLMATVAERVETRAGASGGTWVRAWFSRDPARSTLPE